jgi:hypothetical protein
MFGTMIFALLARAERRPLVSASVVSLLRAGGSLESDVQPIGARDAHEPR